MSIELDEVVVQYVTDDALELAAGGAQGGELAPTATTIGPRIAGAGSLR